LNKISGIKKQRIISDKAKWALILAEFAAIYILIVVSIYQQWYRHDYLRFLMLIPMYHAGATFGYTGSILTSLLAVFLFVPLIPTDTPEVLVHFTPETSIILIGFYVVFGVVVGGTVGSARKTRRYIESLSNIFVGILGEPDEYSVILRSCRETAKITDAKRGAALLCPAGKSDPADWILFDMAGGSNTGGTITGPPSDSILVWSAMRNSALSTNSVTHDERLIAGESASNLSSAMIVPVSYDDIVYGAYLVANKRNNENFTEKELSIAKTIAETAGGAIHNISQEKERQVEKLREEQMRELFSRFVSSAVADYVLENPGILTGRWQEVTVLVSDIRDFTAMSEIIPARDLVAQLNEYFSAMVDVIFEHKGTIDKFIGDCIIAYWGAPAPDPDHAANALRAASAMAVTLDGLNSSWAARGMKPYSAGIAIHTCNVLIGNLGDDRKKAFTIIGEEIEKAAGMESLTKTLGKRIILSETAVRAAGFDSRFTLVQETSDEYGRIYAVAVKP
jgi:class 3 adenylate cyclase